VANLSISIDKSYGDLYRGKTTQNIDIYFNCESTAPHLLFGRDWSVGWLHITSDYILKIRKYKELQIDFLNDE
jgi:hypothetical protein